MSLTPAMKQMLREMTPAQLETMIQVANQPRLTIAFPSTSVRDKGKKKLAHATPRAKTTRPLNSWIAFRSKKHGAPACELTDTGPGYYAVAFPKYQQKDISGFLTNIWHSDPFKAKWSILAKSYSVIRDKQGKDNAPLDEFLSLAGPYIGIINPKDYLQIMGWEVAIDRAGQTIMNKYEVELDEGLFLSNVSVNDIIRHCYRLGFFTGSLAEVLLSENNVVLTMATSVQHPATSAPHQAQSSDSSMDGVHGNSMGEETHDTMTHESIDDAGTGYDDKAVMEEDTQVEFAHDTQTSVDHAGDGHVAADTDPTSHMIGTGPVLSSDNSQEPEPEPHSTWATINPASNLSAANYQLSSDYPYNAEFDPDSPSFVFDPFNGNQFDVFDMSDPSWNDTIDFDGCS